MKSLAKLVMCACIPLLMAGCANLQPVAPLPSSEVLSDASFTPPADTINAGKLFEISPAMRSYLRSPEFTGMLRRMGTERGLIEALYKKGELKLEYDSSITRNAAETYEARMGNCLSLVVMTAAFAKELGMSVQFQDVVIDDIWSRSGGIYFASTHVNLILSKRKPDPMRGYQPGENTLTIDFMPPEQASALRTHPLEERDIVAMYMNNRAAESLTQKRLDDAYWWARAAILHLPTFATGYNTLGVIYQRHGDFVRAERAFKAALKLEPDSTVPMHNLIPVLAAQGKKTESDALAAHLISLEPTPPYFYFNKGTAAMEKGQYAEARRLFAKEVRRSPFNHEFHFWLALAHWRLGEASAARDEMAQAVENSTTKDATERYSAKLAALRAMASGTYPRAY